MSCSRCPKSRVSPLAVAALFALAALGVLVAERATAGKLEHPTATTAPSR